MLYYSSYIKKVLESLKVQILERPVGFMGGKGSFYIFSPQAKTFLIFHPGNNFELCTATTSAPTEMVRSALTGFHHPWKCPRPG